MKKFTTLALAGVMSMAMVGSAFAADPLFSGSVSGESGKPETNMYVVDTTSLSESDRAKIASVDFNFTLNSTFMNGGGGYNKDGETWTQPDGYEFSAAGQNTYTMPVEGYALSSDGTDSLQIQMWWLNVNDDGSDGSFTLDSVVAKDADGNVLLTLGDAVGAGDTSTPAVYLAAAAALAGLALVVTRKKMA